MSQFTHINASGEANMVDVSAKAETVREARAEAYIDMGDDDGARDVLNEVMEQGTHEQKTIAKKLLDSIEK